MTSVGTTPTQAAAPRREPAFGGFSVGFLALEIRRILRNKRSMIFTLVMPSGFFLLFGNSGSDRTISGADALAYTMVSFAVYGAMVACTSAGASVAVERAQGWTRQLRLTPLRPPAYIAVKILAALTLGGIAIVVVDVVGALRGVGLPWHVWLLTGLAAWAGALVFAAFGLFVGYLVPAENVMQLLGPALAIMASLGGVFIPLQYLPHGMQQLALWLPVYGVSAIARAPLTGDAVTIREVANVVAWTLIFGGGAASLFRRDTARV